MVAAKLGTWVVGCWGFVACCTGEAVRAHALACPTPSFGGPAFSVCAAFDGAAALIVSRGVTLLACAIIIHPACCAFPLGAASGLTTASVLSRHRGGPHHEHGRCDARDRHCADCVPACQTQTLPNVGRGFFKSRRVVVDNLTGSEYCTFVREPPRDSEIRLASLISGGESDLGERV